MNRSALIKAPARIVFAAPSGSTTFYTKDDIQPNIDRETFDLSTSAHGKIDERDKELSVKLSVTPDGRWNAAIIAALWPYANSLMGSSIYSDTDRALQIHDTNSHLYTIIAAAVTKMPSLKFSSVDTLIGAVEFTGLRGNDLGWDDANSLLTIATNGGTFADATFSSSLIKTQPYTATWGAVAGFGTMDTEDGFTFEPEITLQPDNTNNLGVVNYRIASLGAMVKCVPIGPNASQILDALYAQGAGAQRGRSLNANSASLTITGADGITYLTVPGAALKTAGFRFGQTVLRQGEIGFVATRTMNAGVQDALFTLAAE